MELHWFEAKQLDRVTNFSTETEIIKAGIKNKIIIQYYCTFSKTKKYYGLPKNINYLGVFTNRYLKLIEFNIRVVLKSIQLILNKNNNKKIIMVNQDLIKHVLPAIFINKIFNKRSKFIVDVRTTPTNPATFDIDMKLFHKKFKYAIKKFDGLSFITPFMEKYILNHYNIRIPTVNWSSGVDLNLFDYNSVSSDDKKDDSFTIFYHGGISESRGNLNLVKACEKLVNEGYKIKLDQIGILVDHSIKNYIKEKKIENWCRILSPEKLEEMPQYIANSDLPVLPFPNFIAWRVSSPIKLMEYLAMGKKVLAPDIEAFTDVFGHEENYVYYFKSNKGDDVNEISIKIKQIIRDQEENKIDPFLMINLVKQKYTWDIQSNNLFDFCKKI